MPAKLSKEWEQEFDMLREMQENRMHSAAAKQCLDRCTRHLDFLTNALLPHEGACISECLAKRAQTSFIISANIAKFEELESRQPQQQKKGWF